MDQPHFSLSQESGKCFLITYRQNDHLAELCRAGHPEPQAIDWYQSTASQDQGCISGGKLRANQKLHVLSTALTLLAWQKPVPGATKVGER